MSSRPSSSSGANRRRNGTKTRPPKSHAHAVPSTGATQALPNPYEPRYGWASPALAKQHAQAELEAQESAVLPGYVSTYAGSGQYGHNDGLLNACEFLQPISLTFGPDGTLFVVERRHRVRTISPQGIVTLYAGCNQHGYEDGPRLDAKFFRPTGIVADQNGNVLVCDSSNNCVRLLNTSTDLVETYAGANTAGFLDGTLQKARFNSPHSIAISRSGDLFVTDNLNQAIRYINVAEKTVSTLLCGFQFKNQINTHIRFNLWGPEGIAVLPNDDIIFVDGSTMGRIHRIDMATREIQPFVMNSSESVAAKPKYVSGNPYGGQNGRPRNQAAIPPVPAPDQAAKPDTPSEFCLPSAVCVSPQGDIFVSESGINSILKNTSPGSRVMENFAGEGMRGAKNGAREVATFNFPQGLAIDPLSGDLFVCDHDNHKIRRIRAAVLPQHLGPTALPGLLASDANAPSDRNFLHGPTGFTIALHSQFLAATAPLLLNSTLKSQAENLDGISWNALSAFFTLLHGVNVPLVPGGELKEEVMKIADACGSRVVIEANLKATVQDGIWINGISSFLHSLYGTLAKKSNQGHHQHANQHHHHHHHHQQQHHHHQPHQSHKGSSSSSSSISSIAAQCPPNFELECGGQVFRVHDWVLAGRWPYFSRCLAFGGAEFHNRSISLPTDCLSPGSLKALLEFIYTNRAPDFVSEEQKGKVTIQDLVSILENAPLLGFVSMDESLLPGLAPFIIACVNALKQLADPTDPTQTRSSELLTKFWWDSKWSSSSSSLWK